MKIKKRALIIDHDDSFIWNIKAWLDDYFDVQIISHRDLRHRSTSEFQLIILSPGPLAPRDYPHSVLWLQGQTSRQPTLGICLGFQLMTIVTGGDVIPLENPVHGKCSRLRTEMPRFDGAAVGRYHSLHCVKKNRGFKILATTEEERTIMWAEDREKNWIGFQFHPESFLTERGQEYAEYIEGWVQTCNP